MEPKLAIGTSAAIGLPVSLAGALAYGWQGWGISGDQWSVGYIDMPATLALVLGTLLTVRLGVATAHWLPSRALAGLFALFLIFNGSHLLYSALGYARSSTNRSLASHAIQKYSAMCRPRRQVRA